MKRWKYLLISIAAVFLVRMEHTGIRIDQLEPVETVRISQEDGRIVVQTDTGAKGSGNDLDRAINNLYASASSMVFLDTAQYLLVDSDTEELILQLCEILRPNTLVCRIRGDAELEDITKYLKNHRPSTRLLDVRAGKRGIQTLYYQKGRGQLVE